MRRKTSGTQDLTMAQGLDRRRLLGLLGVGAVPLAACSAQPSAKEAAGTGELTSVARTKAGFLHGLASGDPYADSVLLWTRFTPVDLSASTRVTWFVHDTQGTLVARGEVMTGPERDHTVKVVVEGLKPATDYRYGFEAAGYTSEEGRTRTLPVGDLPKLTLAVASCSNFVAGLFNGYDAIAREPELDAVIHLGDYIYEYGGAEAYGVKKGFTAEAGRLHQPPHEIVSLSDYRLRHAQYKADPDLQAAHARAPWIVVFDDHEITNDPWRDGAENHQPDDGEGAWAARKAVALKAYYEWMPIREPRPGAMLEGINRSFRFGNLAALHMLETRLLARDKQLDYLTDLPAGSTGETPVEIRAFKEKLNDPNRALMGPEQRAWLAGEVQSAVRDGVVWQLIGSQVIMARVKGPDVLKIKGELFVEGLLALAGDKIKTLARRYFRMFRMGLPFNLDAWDGYPVERERVLNLFRRAGARPVVLTGDSHCLWANHLTLADGSLAGIEFGAPGITSPGVNFGAIMSAREVSDAVVAANPDVIAARNDAQGYVRVTLTPEQVRGDWIEVSTLTSRDYSATVTKSFVSQATPTGLSPLKTL
ncbi:MAG: alkaline phosphatase D family protein [Asticcacaulis sp.]